MTYSFSCFSPFDLIIAKGFPRLRRCWTTGRLPLTAMLWLGFSFFLALPASAGLPGMTALQLKSPRTYRPDIPVFIRVELRDASGGIDRRVWDAEVTLSSDQPGVTLSTNRVILRNGLGSALVRVNGESDIQLTASWEGLQAAKALTFSGDAPVTEVQGPLSGEDLLWEGTMHVTGDVVVPAGSTLQIHPGTWVLLDGVVSGENGTDIEVRGAVESLGTEADPITFTASDPATYWGEIRHDAAAPSIYRHTIFNRGGNSPGGGHTGSGPVFRPLNSEIQFEGCSISDNIGKAMQAEGSDLRFENVLIARSVMGPEIAGTALVAESSWFMEMFGPDDNDGIYLHDQGPGQELRLDRCVFAFVDDDAIDNLGSTVTIHQCVVRDAADKGISLFAGQATIQRCLIAGNDIGISIKGRGTQQGRVDVDRTTVFCRSRGIAVEDKFGEPDVFLEYYVTNSIIHASDEPMNSVYTDYDAADIHIVYSNVGEPWPGEGNQTVAPLFVNDAADYRLRPDSPCIDAGDPESGLDPDGTQADLGAFAVDQQQVDENQVTGVVINEILFHPASEDVREEYVELLNRGPGPVNVGGFELSGAVHMVLPPVSLAAGEYLVVAADLITFTNRFPAVTNVIGNWEGRLSNQSEEVRLKNTAGDLIDAVHYADEGDWAIRRRGESDRGHRGWDWLSRADGDEGSLELLNAALPNDSGQNWASGTTTNGTPGRVNSPATNNIPPMILDAAHYPMIPGSSDSVTVTARLLDESSDGVKATLHYRADGESPGPFVSVAMVDDGNHGDGAAGDRLFGARIPPMPEDTVVEFYLEASDATGLRRTWPTAALYEDGVRGQSANLLYQVDDSIPPPDQPLYKLIMTEAERSELEAIGQAPEPETNTDAEMNGTFISIDGTGRRLRYQVGIRNRGHGSRNRQPNNYRVNFSSDQPWQGVTALNLNAQFTHAQHIGSVLSLKSGVAGGWSRAVQVRVNNADLTDTGSWNRTFGSYAANEVLNSEFADRQFPLDGSGNLYRGIRDLAPADLSYRGDDPLSYTNSYFKRTNSSDDDWTDLIELTRVLTETPDDQFTEEVRRVIDVEQWMRHLAVMNLFNSRETGLNTGDGDDYYMYRGMQDPRFRLVAYDLDTILGEGSTAGERKATLSGTGDGSLFSATEMPAFERFMKWPEFVPIYYRELLELTETTFAPVQFNAEVERTLGGYVPKEVRDRMKAWNATRNLYVRAIIPTQLSIEHELTRKNGYWHTTEPVIRLSGLSHAVKTRSVLVNGQPAQWTAWQAAWESASVMLSPGINRVVVQTLNGKGNPIDQAHLDVWFEAADRTPVTGTLSENSIWTAAAGPYAITGSVTIPQGLSLTVEPGATVYFEEGASLRVNGQLTAAGTPSRRIRFTRSPGSEAHWGGLQFQDSNASNRLAYVDLEFAGANPEVIRLENSRLELENLSWGSATNTIIESLDSSLRVRDSRFPETLQSAVHGRGMLAADPFFVIQNSTFSDGTGSAAARIDYAGGPLPGPVPQFLSNDFEGGDGDGIKLHGSDAYVEGNRFEGFGRYTADEIYAISARADNGRPSQPTVVRNFFVDNAHAILAEGGSFVSLENNTIVACTGAVADFHETQSGPAVPPGRGVSIEGSILWRNTRLFSNVYADHADWGTTEITINHSFVPGSAVFMGTGNRFGYPRFVTDGLDPQLRPGSPASGSGPNGLDMGADVSSGVSVSGEPPAVTSRTDAQLVVGGPGITHYRYRMSGDGDFGEETPVTDPIELTNLEAGEYAVEVIGKNAAGIWQSPDMAVRSRTWQVDPARFPVRINEVLARNVNRVYHQGTYPDVIELYNESDIAVDLSGMRLSDRPDETDPFVFPEGSQIGSQSYLVLYANDPDGTPGVHLGFALDQDGEGVFLFDRSERGDAVLDSVSFGLQLPNRSIGRMPDGRWSLNWPTFGKTNRILLTGDVAELRINEWLARSQNSSPGEDFIELFNPDTIPVELSGLYWTDEPIGDLRRHSIAALSFIDAESYRVFLADDRPGTGADHLNFKLAAEQGMIALSDSDGNRIDLVSYGPQSTDISQGRHPENRELYPYFSEPTPGSKNPQVNQTVTEERVPLLALDHIWSYNQDGIDLGETWREPDYDDQSWPQGPGLLYVEEDELPGPKNTPLNLGAITYYFRTSFQVGFDPGSTQVELSAGTVLDDGAVIYLNGIEIQRIGIDSGPIDAGSEADRTVGDADLEIFRLPADALQSGGNVLAVEVHQTGSNSSDVVWGMSLDAILTRTNIAPGTVVLNEVLAENRSYPAADGSVVDWIELYNPTDTTISLEGYSLTDDPVEPRKWSFASDTRMSPHDFLVVKADGDAPASSDNAGFGLKAGGEAVYLIGTRDKGNEVVDSILYGRQIPDYSLGRVPAGTGAWQLTQPTPNTLNQAVPLGDVSVLKINEWLADPISGADWFELFNPGTQPVALGGLYLSDDLNDRTQFRIRPHSYLGTGMDAYAQWIADNDPEQGPDHLNFKLSGDGESIGLFDSNAALVDSVTFELQQEGVSEGRYPDGTSAIIRFPGSPTPGAPNRIQDQEPLDTDGDGLPDQWEIDHGLDSSRSEDAFEDADDDGFNNRSEYLSGTDPNDGRSYLRLDWVRLDGNSVVLAFQAVTGKSYVIWYRDPLSDDSWRILEEIPPAASTATRMVQDATDSATGTRFYRLTIPEN